MLTSLAIVGQKHYLDERFLMRKIISLISLSASISLFAGTDSTGETSFKWSKKEVKVCWLDDSPINKDEFNENQFQQIGDVIDVLVTMRSSLKKKIQALIQTEFTLNKTGITFTGWSSCRDTKDYDLILLTGDTTARSYTNFLGLATIGRGDIVAYDLMDKTKKSFIYIDLHHQKPSAVTATELTLIVTLHEFGHAAGLRHEHIRGKDCSHFEKQHANTSFFSVYDSSSIMNYCFLDFIENEVGFNFFRLEKLNYENYQRIQEEHNMTINISPRVLPYSDDSIFTITPVSEIEGLLEYKIRLGLSKGDLHGLKCMYVYDPKTFSKVCHADFRLNDDGL